MVSPSFTNLARYFQQYGVMDFLLPFLLVFTIIYAVTGRISLFKEKNFRIVIALTLALVFVAPHITGSYPLGYDPVQVLNETLPSISLLSVAAVMVLLLLGIFGKGFSEAAAPLIALISLGFVVFIFGSSLNLWRGPYDVFSWWSPEITELMIILLIFGVIVWLIVKEPGQGSFGSSAKNAWKSVGSIIEDIGGKR
ncbi:MAG TPA: hypothetical protein VJA18_00625 [Candidatus Nanoarchaeia archaeon]|nr:hypothetical protein [Candidatus Nanoarchaeia archaeon]